MKALLTLVAALMTTILSPASGLAVADDADCRIAMYLLSDGSRVDIAPSENSSLRWRRMDGTTGALRKQLDETWSSTFGWTGRPDGKSVRFGDCQTGKITFDGVPGRRMSFEVTETIFACRDVKLAGRLVLPKGTKPVPIVVLVHGAEGDSARASYYLQRLLPAEGIGVFVYDKRGTGSSGGKYTQDYDVLADDAVSALREARRLAGSRAGRIGFQGGSQGGWVAPLAETRIPVDFVIGSFGLAVNVIDEDREEIELEMKLKGHAPEETAKALEVAIAAEVVMISGFSEGSLESFEALRTKYKNEPWYKDLRGNLTRLLLPHSVAELRAMADQFKFGTPWFYDSMPTLRKVNAPQLWILGEDDLDAPSQETGRRIKELIAEERPITLAVFPNAEHGMTEYEVDQHGERVSTRYAAGYFAMMRDFIRDGHLGPRYGASVIAGPKVHGACRIR